MKYVDEGKNLKKDSKGKVAVIGMACRLPGANDINEYWDLLTHGICATKDMPLSRKKLDLGVEYKSDKDFCGFIDDIDKFDPHFFGITPREALRMDPQQRLLLEVVWEAIEDAGIKLKDLSGYDTGVFVGAGAMFGSAHYFMHQVKNKSVDIYSYTGAESSTLANKIAYVFDFRGPSFALDSACSSSLTIIDDAYMRICSGQCATAIVGSSNLLLSSSITNMFREARLLNSDGKVKAFDIDADGYSRGEGAGVVILKSLDKALEDGNDIWAVISGTAINHGGRNGRGFTYPNSEAQQCLLQSAYKNADVLSNEVHYIEAHGTGTPTGDEIELMGINGVISKGRSQGDTCKIGSVKTNIGHLEYAAGIAAFIKVCLMLKNKKLVPSLNYEYLNSNVNGTIKDLCVEVQTTLESWPHDKKLIAGVSSFGIGGSNAHIVLESIENYVDDIERFDNSEGLYSGTYLFPVSAKGVGALKDNANKYLQFILYGGDSDIYDLCFSASVHRNHFKDRVVFLCKDKQDLILKLGKYLNNQDDSCIFQTSDSDSTIKDLVFVFSDCRGNWLDEKKVILSNDLYFLDVLHEVDDVYQSIYGENLIVIKDEKDIQVLEKDALLMNVYYFIYQVTLYRMWLYKGILPTCLVGYRQGEIVVEYLAGKISLHSAIRLIECYTKIQLDISCRVFNVMASFDEVEELLVNYNEKAFITAINSPNMQELSVKSEYADDVIEDLVSRGLYYKEVIAKPKTKRELSCVNDVKILEVENAESNIKTYCTTVEESGEFVDIFLQNWKEREFLASNFSKRIYELVENECNGFVEIGSDAIMSLYISDICQSIPSRAEREVVISSEGRINSLDTSIMQGIAELYAAGYPIDWESVYTKGKYIKMPSYVWQNQSYWIY